MKDVKRCRVTLTKISSVWEEVGLVEGIGGGGPFGLTIGCKRKEYKR